MNSILPVYLAFIFTFLGTIAVRAHAAGSITLGQAIRVYVLITGLLIWTGLLIFMGIKSLHIALMQSIPLLWQAFVPVTLWVSAVMFSAQTRQALMQIAQATPALWLAGIQILRIGAIGGISKGVQGSITSDYVFWIGIPDFVFGLSAVLIAYLIWREKLAANILVVWNLVGFGVIFFPTFLIMPYWMNEPGFSFIFEFPMILAPGIVVSTLISLNLMQAWAAWDSYGSNKTSQSTLKPTQ